MLPAVASVPGRTLRCARRPGAPGDADLGPDRPNREVPRAKFPSARPVPANSLRARLRTFGRPLVLHRLHWHPKPFPPARFPGRRQGGSGPALQGRRPGLRPLVLDRHPCGLDPSPRPRSAQRLLHRERGGPFPEGRRGGGGPVAEAPFLLCRHASRPAWAYRPAVRGERRPCRGGSRALRASSYRACQPGERPAVNLGLPATGTGLIGPDTAHRIRRNGGRRRPLGGPPRSGRLRGVNGGTRPSATGSAHQRLM